MAEASWVEDPGESTPLNPFPRSEEQERRRKRDLEGCTSEPPPKRLSKTDIVDDDPKTSEPPRRLLSLSTKGHASAENKEVAVSKPASRKRPLLSLKGRRKQPASTESRFYHYSSPEIDKYKEKMIPKSTLRSTKWAFDIFEQWISARLSSGHKVPPDDLLCSSDGKVVCEWLCHFFTEVRKADGNPYCPRSLSSILAGLQRHMQSVSSHSLKVQDTD